MLYKGVLKPETGGELQYEVLDGRMIRIMGRDTSLHCIKDAMGDVISVGNTFSTLFNIGNLFPVSFTSDLIATDEFITMYKIEYIYQSGLSFTLCCKKKTIASLFVTPLIFEKRGDIEYSNYFINTYTGDKKKVDYNDDHVFLHYRFFPFPGYYQMEDKLRKHKDYVDYYGVDSYTMMLVFKIPPDLKIDFELIKVGQYSNITDKAKLRILDFHGSKRTDQLGQILYKDKELKQQLELNLNHLLPEGSELFDIPDPKLEVLNYEKEN